MGGACNAQTGNVQECGHVAVIILGDLRWGLKEDRPNPYCLSCSDCNPAYVNAVNFGKEVYASHDVQEGAKDEGPNHGKIHHNH
jgi:hypothetical protein